MLSFFVCFPKIFSVSCDDRSDICDVEVRDPPEESQFDHEEVNEAMENHLSGFNVHV